MVVKNKDDDSRFIRGAVSDITERHLITVALQEAQDDLEQQVEERTVGLLTAFSEIKKLKNQREAENIYFRQERKMKQSADLILGQSDGLRHVLFRAEQVAPTNTTVLILGETVNGKELIAAAILCSGPVLHLVDKLPISFPVLASSMRTLEETERNQIFKTLLETQWRIEGKDGAAEILGLHPSNLRARMHKLGIVRKQTEKPD